jgi:hypothetical protein
MRPRALLVLSILLLFFAPTLGQVGAAAPGEWAATTDYPLHVAGDSCVTYSDYVYCVGGFDAAGNDYNSVYYAQLSPSGVGSWTATTPYPAKVDSAACFTSGASIYCVGGENSTAVLDEVYTAPISPSGLGGWSRLAPYPSTIASASCVVSSGYVYCVGGFDVRGDGSSLTYYSSISSGLSSWTSTTLYPLDAYTVPCVEQANYIYCIAGQQEILSGGTAPINNTPMDYVYYAPLSASGIGSWSAFSDYPEALSSASCVTSSAEVYCLGGFGTNQLSSTVGYSSEVSQGMGPWTGVPSYPVPFDLSSCVSYSSSIYCVAGRSYSTEGLSVLNSVYYMTLGPSTSTSSVTSAPSTSSPSTSSSTSSTSSASTSSSAISSTAPEFPGAAAVPLVLAAAMLATAVLGRRVAHPGR